MKIRLARLLEAVVGSAARLVVVELSRMVGEGGADGVGCGGGVVPGLGATARNPPPPPPRHELRGT